jgi:hypothetical protein
MLVVRLCCFVDLGTVSWVVSDRHLGACRCTSSRCLSRPPGMTGPKSAAHATGQPKQSCGIAIASNTSGQAAGVLPSIPTERPEPSTGDRSRRAHATRRACAVRRRLLPSALPRRQPPPLGLRGGSPLVPFRHVRVYLDGRHVACGRCRGCIRHAHVRQQANQGTT